MKVRRTLTAILGTIKITTAVSPAALACILYFKLFGIRTPLEVTIESVYLQVSILTLFGCYSLINELCLTYE